jgi:hypothetical protein
MVSKEGAQPPPPPNCLGDAGVATGRSLTKAFQFHNGELVILEQLCKTQDEIAGEPGLSGADVCSTNQSDSHSDSAINIAQQIAAKVPTT